MALETWSRAFSITPYYSNDLAPPHLMSIKCPAQREPQHRTNFARNNISPLYGYKRPRGYELIRRKEALSTTSPGAVVIYQKKVFRAVRKLPPHSPVAPGFLKKTGSAEGSAGSRLIAPVGASSAGAVESRSGLHLLSASTSRCPGTDQLHATGRGSLVLTDQPQTGLPAGGEEMGWCRWGPPCPTAPHEYSMSQVAGGASANKLLVLRHQPLSPPCRNACNPISPVPLATRPAPAPL